MAAARLRSPVSIEVMSTTGAEDGSLRKTPPLAAILVNGPC